MSSGLKFRPELEGLRGLAVAAVTLFHLSITGFEGGYVGVDVFFVLSGYLISQLIEHDLRSGNPSLARFYIRRSARILPALLVMLFAVALLSQWLYFGQLYRSFGGWLASSALFFSNITYAMGAGYFSAESELNPLLHTWSLSVEEQYYLVIPLLLWLRRTRPAWRTHAMVAALSFAAALITGAKMKGFYFSPARFWEFSLGSLVGPFVMSLPSRLRRQLTSAGVVTIVFSIVLFDGHSTSPIPAPLFGTLGAAMLIAGDGEGPAGWLLRSRPVRFLGRISYSVYLWHWPLIVIARYLRITELTSVDRALLAAASVLLGYLSWRWVEVGMRAAIIERPRAVLVPVLGAALAVVVVGLMSRSELAVRDFDATTQRLASYGDERGAFHACLDRPAKECVLGDREQRPSFVLWGDSFASAIADQVDVVARGAGRAGIMIAAHSCPALLNVDSWWRPSTAACRGSKQRLSDAAQNPDIKLIILHANWERALGAPSADKADLQLAQWLNMGLRRRASLIEELRQRLTVTLQSLARNDLKLAVITTVPRPRAAVPMAMAVASAFGREVRLGTTFREFRESSGALEDMLRAASEAQGASWVAPSADLCDWQECRVVANGVPLYFDASHLSAFGARQVAHVRRLFGGTVVDSRTLRTARR